ncbi:MAG: SusD/RagB family nutrient-binding outer membrane lipoprotein, partial [Bacteroidetes bacterium]|nr:SusD/RagB family nutrient-binding outer membrane lipoprotein [Bacteroidota bacterium]
MKKNILYITGIALVFAAGTGCKKYLDINSDPDTTQSPSNSSVLPQCMAAMATGLQSDGGLYVAKYTQNWLTSNSTSSSILYDQQGYSWSGGTMAATWTMVYTAMGGNLNYIIENSAKTKAPVFAGVAYALKAWSFQHCTDYNGDIPFHDAFKDTMYFHYDTQEAVYKGVDSLCRLALDQFNQITDATTASAKLALGDIVYAGDINKWKRFTYGVLARNWHHLTNKATYNADSVIKYCDNAMSGVADDFCVPFDATVNNNANYFGTFRDNMGTLRFSNYIVRLLDGTTLTGSNVPANRDPRLSIMLSASQDTTNGNG